MAETLKSVYSAQVLIPGAQLADEQLQGIIRALRTLGKEAKDQVQTYQMAFNKLRNSQENGFDGKNKKERAKAEKQAIEEYNAALIALKKTIQQESLLSKGVFSNAEAQNINKFNKLVGELSRAMEGVKKNSKMEQGTFGLDSKNIQSAQKALKDLNTNISATNFLWRDNKGNQALKDQLITLAQNRAAVRDLIKGFEEKSKAEKDAQAMSNTIDRARVEYVKESKKQELKAKKEAMREEIRLARVHAAELKEIFNTAVGRDVFKHLTNIVENKPYAVDAAKNRAMMYRVRRQDEATQTFADASRNQFEYRQSSRNQFSNDAYTRARISAQQRSADEFLLSEEWKRGGGGSTKFTSNKLGDNKEIRKVTADILALQKQIVTLAREEELTDARRSKIIEEILRKEQARKNLRSREAHNQAINDPEAGSRYAEHQVARLSTTGRGSLLQVQAVLQANYAILNTFNNGIRRAITNTIEYEAALKDMQAISGSTNLEMASLDKTVRGISTTTKFSAVELSDAGKILAQAGLTAREIQAALPSIATLATATGSTLKETVDLMTSVVGVFDKTVADIPDVGNKISATLNMSKANAESLRLGLSYVGSTAKQTGVSLEETLASFGAMTNAGIKSGSTLGTGMRQILVEMQKPSKEYVDALARIGLTVSDVDVKSKGWTQTLKTLSKAGFQASDAIKSFDVRGASAFNALLGNANDIDKIIKSYDDHTAAVRASETQMDSLKSQLALLSNNFVELTTNALGPTFNVFKTLAGALTSTLQVLKPFTPLLSAIAPVVIGLGVAIVGSLIGSTLRAIPIIGTLSAELAVARTAALATAGSFTLLGTTTSAGAIANSQMALGVALSSVRTSMVAAGGATAYFSGMLKGALVGALNAAKVAVLTLWGMIVANPLLAAVAAITSIAAAVMAFGSKTTTAKERVDELTTSMNDNDSSIEKTKNSLEKIDTTLAQVSAKNELMKTGLIGSVQATDLLKTATDQTNSVLNSFGRTVDSGTTSLEEMVTKLREARGEMLALQQAQTEKAIVNAGLLTVAKQNVAEEASGETSRMKLKTLLIALPNKEKVVSNGSATRDYSEVIEAFRLYTGALKDFPELSKLTDALNEIGASKTLSESRREAFTEQGQILSKVTEAMEASKRSTQTMETLIKAQADGDAVRSFIGNRENLLQSKATLQDRVKAVALTKGVDPLKNKAEYVELAADEARKLRDEIQKLKDEATQRFHSTGKDAIKGNTYREVMNKANTAQQGITGEYNSLNLSPYSANVKADMKREVENLDSKIGNMIKSRTASLDSVIKVLNSKHEVQLRELKITSEASGDSDYPNKLEDLKKKQSEEIISTTHKLTEAGREASAKSLAQTKAALQELIDANRMKAENAFKSISPFSTLAEIQKKAQESLEATNEALRLEAIKFDKEWESRKGTPNEKIAREGFAFKQSEDRKRNIQQFHDPEMEAWGKEVLGLRDSKESNAKSNSDEAMLALTNFQNQKGAQNSQLEILKGKSGEVSQARIALLELERNKQEIEALNAHLDAENARINSLASNTNQASKVVSDLIAMRDKAEENSEEQQFLIVKLTKAQEELTAAAKNELQARKEIKATEESIARKTVVQGKSADLVEIKRNMGEAWEAYSNIVNEMDVNEVLGTGMLNVFKGSTATIGQGLMDIATKTQTVGGAFKSMALTMAKAMLQVVAQMAALNMVKMALGIAGNLFGPSVTGLASLPASVNTSFPTVPNSAVGGQALPGAFAYSSQPIQKFAGGGKVFGGVPGKDSVPAFLMPGEFVVKKSVVDAVGSNFFHSLNQQGNAVVQSSQSSMAQAPNDSKGKGLGGTVNVWVVTPDQKPSSMGPKDVIATVSDDINRNGSIKKLIKQIQMGQA